MKRTFTPIRIDAEQQRLNGLAEDLDALARMVRRVASANDRSEPVMIGCLRNALPDAAKALAAIQAEFGDQNAAETVRWNNRDFAETAVAAGGTLRIVKEAA